MRAETIGARPSATRVVRVAKNDSAPTPTPMTLGARVVVVADVVRETDDAVSLVLRDPSGAPFVFSPGQFLTLIVEVAGERLRRSYSISSSADVTDTATVTVKRVAGGKVSGHLVERAQAGMHIEVLGPAGAFTPSSHALVLFAGGSGITPMMSIARTTLARDPEARIALIYGSRSARDIIFKEALDALVREHAPRLVVRHVLGEALDRTVAARELDALGGEHAGRPETEYFMCGPEPMMQEVRLALGARGVPDAAVREEKFTPARPLRVAPANDAPRAENTVQLRVRREGTDPAIEVRIPTNVPILQAALAAGVELPYSCTEGGCGACRVHVDDPSTIDMDVANCLSSKEIREGYILTCVSRARGNVELQVE
ncbi:ferredoxin--NADP reductase [Pendulispora rubella]|uniref:Ferredoxin--NADP reductase n=2 Tax=Pendulispora rubella TaxID=2741070 RepID=A0ABZ2L0X5_9BACT